jgi:hypothetical protein
MYKIKITVFIIIITQKYGNYNHLVKYLMWFLLLDIVFFFNFHIKITCACSKNVVEMLIGQAWLLWVFNIFHVRNDLFTHISWIPIIPKYFAALYLIVKIDAGSSVEKRKGDVLNEFF